MTEPEIIESTPLDVGDTVALDMHPAQPGMVDGRLMDVVHMAVPVGKGLLVQRWLERQCGLRPPLNIDDGQVAA